MMQASSHLTDTVRAGGRSGRDKVKANIRGEEPSFVPKMSNRKDTVQRLYYILKLEITLSQDASSETLTSFDPIISI